MNTQDGPQWHNKERAGIKYTVALYKGMWLSVNTVGSQHKWAVVRPGQVEEGIEGSKRAAKRAAARCADKLWEGKR